MDIFGILTMIGGLALFLFGMDFMGANLSKASGGKLEHILEKNPYPELVLPIEEDHLRLLQEAFFYLCREKDPRAREIQKDIRKLPIRELWPSLPPVVRKWTLLHIFAGPLYRWHLSAK